MEIINKTGNILDTETIIIAHQVNCVGVSESDIFQKLNEKYPELNRHYSNISFPLGHCDIVQVSNNQYVANLYGQYNTGYTREKFMSYDALDIALSRLKHAMVSNNISSVSFPKFMGCKYGGGNWEVVFELIKSNFENTNINIEIWENVA